MNNLLTADCLSNVIKATGEILKTTAFNLGVLVPVICLTRAHSLLTNRRKYKQVYSGSERPLGLTKQTHLGAADRPPLERQRRELAALPLSPRLGEPLTYSLALLDLNSPPVVNFRSGGSFRVSWRLPVCHGRPLAAPAGVARQG